MAVKIPAHKRCAERPIEVLPPAPRLRLGVGELDAVVAVGEVVSAGQAVARTAVGARWEQVRHSPYSGTVAAVERSAAGGVVVIDGVPAPAITARTHRALASAKPAEIVAAVREAGLVGLGGAMFPTWVKLAQESGIDTVLVNASESEPFVCCDQRVLLEHRAEVECGMEWIRRAVGAADAKIVATGKGYPYGHESLLIAEVLGREVPRGGRARDVGVTVCNVQTARAVHAALCHGRPLIERVITVDGAAVGAPGNYLVALGTPIHHILDACRTDLARISLLLAGGPMMGCEVELDASLAPGSAAILALGAGEHDAMVAGPCIRCGRCLEACPLDLPAGLLVQRPDARALECIECGVCEFTCVAARPLVDELRRAKAELRGEGRDEP